MFINYAHRGASEYAAENTFAGFYLGLACRANGIETDIRRSADGKLILFHDKKLERTTDGTGNVSDYTFDELRRFTVRGKYVNDKIVLFSEFLEHFAWRDLQFALEIKESDICGEVAKLIYAYGIEDKVTVTSFHMDYLKEMKNAAPDIRLGWLTKDIESGTVEELINFGAGQICPPAPLVTSENVAALKARGLNIRAWGVTDTELMKKCYLAGVDGMTVNFPDKLHDYIESIK